MHNVSLWKSVLFELVISSPVTIFYFIILYILTVELIINGSNGLCHSISLPVPLTGGHYIHTLAVTQCRHTPSSVKFFSFLLKNWPFLLSLSLSVSCLSLFCELSNAGKKFAAIVKLNLSDYISALSDIYCIVRHWTSALLRLALSSYFLFWFQDKLFLNLCLYTICVFWINFTQQANQRP